jgi:hypothetical protein
MTAITHHTCLIRIQPSRFVFAVMVRRAGL